MEYKRAVLYGDRQVRIETAEFPKVNGNPIIKVTHVGICGSDVHYWEEGGRFLGVVSGHEYTGVIEDPAGTPYQKGDRVVGYTQNPKNEPCGYCPSCLTDDFAHCTNRIVKIGVGSELEHPGAFSEYITWFPSGMFPLPDAISNREAALIEPAAVALHAISLSEMRPGDRVLVLGGGIIGQCCAEWARMHGAGMIAITETNHRKMERIREYGIVDHVLDGRAADLEQQLQDLAPGGFDLFFDCVAIAGPVNTAIRSLRRGGTGVLVGVSFAPLEIDYYSTVVFQKRLQGSKGHVPTDFLGVLAALEHKKLDLAKYITHTARLDDLQGTYERIKKQGDDIKIIVEP